MKNTVELYSDSDIIGLRRKNRILRAVTYGVFALAVIACTALCVLTTTGNAARTEKLAIAISTVAGWVTFYLWRFCVKSVQHELTHAEMLKSGKREALTGETAVADEVISIRNSIDFRRVTVGERRCAVIESRADILKKAGKDLTVYTVNGYAAAYDAETEAQLRARKAIRRGAAKRFLKNLWKQLPLYIAWAIISYILWGFVFGLVTDTSAEKKITVFADVEAMDGTALAVKLEEDMPEGIRMVKAHPFSYVMFDDSALDGADILIVPESEIEEYADRFASSEGVKVFDASSGEGAAAKYITYRTRDGKEEDFYLFYGANSVHLEDGAAGYAAERLLKLD